MNEKHDISTGSLLKPQFFYLFYRSEHGHEVTQESTLPEELGIKQSFPSFSNQNSFIPQVSDK